MIELLAQLPDVVSEYSPMAVLAFLVWANHQGRRAMWKRFDRLHQMQAETSKETVQALRSLAGALHDRPCLCENGRVEHAGDSQVRPAIKER